MKFRSLYGLLIPLVCAAIFVKLGFWQLSRHEWRAELNRPLEERLHRESIPLESIPEDSSQQRWLRVRLSGRFLYDQELVQGSRTNAGSPGVHLLTPLRRGESDTLILITRGWVYSPDASSVDQLRWREGEDVTLEGYLLPITPGMGTSGGAGSSSTEGTIRGGLFQDNLEQRLGVPIAPYLIVMTSDSAAKIDSVPRRLSLPAVDAGPHRSYAVQWFSFALIAVVGGFALFKHSRDTAEK